MVLVGPLVFRAPSGLTRRAGLLCAPVGGGPPASRPRCVLLLVAPLVFRAPSGPAAREIATREPDGSEWSISKPARALRTLRRPPHRRRLVADVWLGASARCPARPRHSPRASQISRVKPASPLLARLCVGLKPPSPLLAQAEPQLKPTSPLRAKRSCFLSIFRLQWCCWFQWSLFGGEQWRRRFHVGLHQRSQR